MRRPLGRGDHHATRLSLPGLPLCYAVRMRKDIVESNTKARGISIGRSISEFWQSQPPKARFDATWDLIVHYAKVKGIDVRQLRLDRSVESFQRQRR